MVCGCLDRKAHRAAKFCTMKVGNERMRVAFDTTYGIDAQAFKKQDVKHYSPCSVVCQTSWLKKASTKGMQGYC